MILAFAGMALHMISLSHELNGALPRALECAREALHIWKMALPLGHENVAVAMSLVRSLEQATRWRRMTRARWGDGQTQMSGLN